MLLVEATSLVEWKFQHSNNVPQVPKDESSMLR